MPDKIVNHFVLADGSTAKYDAGALLNLDDTVSLAGYAPDAKAVGDRLTDVENLAETLNEGGLELKDDVIATNVEDWLDAHPEATTTVQDGAITEPKINSAFLKEIKNAYVTPEMFGAVGDGVSDDTLAWKQAINSGEIIYAENTYKTTEPLYFDNDVYMTGKIYNTVSDGIIISGKNEKKYMLNVEGLYGNANQYDGVVLENCYNCTIEFIRVRNYYNGLVLRGYNTGCAYNNIYNALIINFKNAVSLIAVGNSGWVNENHFFGGIALTESNTTYVGTSYGIVLGVSNSNTQLNANNFIDYCCEQTYCAVNLTRSRDNSFYNIRTEGCSYALITDAISARNIVVVSYGNTGVQTGRPNNVVYNIADLTANKFNTLIATTGNLAYSTSANSSYATANGLYKKMASGSYVNSLYNLTSDTMGLKAKGVQACVGFLVNVEKNKFLRIATTVLYGAHRWFIVPFDTNGNFVENAVIRAQFSNFEMSESGALGKYYILQTDVTESEITIGIFTDTVTEVYIGVFVQPAGVVVNKVDIYGTPDNFESYKCNNAQLASIPTTNGYYIGQTVHKTDSLDGWIWDGTSWNNIV